MPVLPVQEKHILTEQVKLALQNAPAGFGGSWFTALLVCVALAQQTGILLWFAAYTLVSIYGFYYILRRRRSPEETPVNRDAWFLLGITSLGGLLWGILPWLAFDPGSIANSTLILGVIAGIIGAALAMMSPFLPCYLTFLLTAAFPLALKLLLQDDFIFILLGMACVVYMVVMYYFAQYSQIATIAAINLRFQNADLLLQLQRESASAHAARDAAQMATTSKSKFLAAASHDLRQPIHAMSLFLEALAHSGLSAQQQEIIHNAKSASLATRDMLNALLDYSKVEAGVMQPSPIIFYLQPLLGQLENELAGLAHQKNIVYRSHETTLAVFVDPALTAQILRNLISNAIRYTETGGVLIGCRRRKHEVLVEIWDTGIGIPATQSEKIFDEFYQIDNPERDRQKGLGLGLAIVRGIAKTMGAPITLASIPGRGSVFRLRLPLAQSTVIEDAEAVELITDFKGWRALVIDDDRMVLDAMRALLVSWQCAVDTAETIPDALHCAGANLPDLVITDYRLRGGDTGADAIARLRQVSGINLPCITITGDIAPERLREALATDTVLLHKPVSIHKLNVAMATFLSPL